MLNRRLEQVLNHSISSMLLSGKRDPSPGRAQAIDPLLQLWDRFTGFDGSRARQASHTSPGGLFSMQEWIGSGKGLTLHITNFNEISSVKP